MLFEFKSSFTSYFLLWMIHLGAIIAALFLPKIMAIAFIILIIISLYLAYKRNYRYPKIAYIKDNQWQLMDENGAITAAQLHGNSIRTRYIIILNFDQASIVVFPDSMKTPDDFRRLSVLLNQVQEEI